MSRDKTLWALAEENNRMLRAMAKDLGLPPPPEFPKPQPDSSLESKSRYHAAPCYWPGCIQSESHLHSWPLSPEGQQKVIDRMQAAASINTPEKMEQVLKTESLDTVSLSTADAIRDAALEEALAVLGNVGHPPLDEWMKAIAAIRALKSKPATDGQHYGNFVAAVGKQRYEAMQSSEPEPIHDFGWALARMREGKKVRLANWVSGCWHLVGDQILDNFNTVVSQRQLAMMAAFSDGWQVVE